MENKIILSVVAGAVVLLGFEALEFFQAKSEAEAVLMTSAAINHAKDWKSTDSDLSDLKA